MGTFIGWKPAHTAASGGVVGAVAGGVAWKFMKGYTVGTIGYGAGIGVLTPIVTTAVVSLVQWTFFNSASATDSDKTSDDVESKEKEEVNKEEK